MLDKAKLHTWQWLHNRSISKEVTALQEKPYGACAVLPFYFEHEKMQGRDMRNILAFNVGSNVRILPYSGKAMEEE